MERRNLKTVFLNLHQNSNLIMDNFLDIFVVHILITENNNLNIYLHDVIFLGGARFDEGVGVFYSGSVETVPFPNEGKFGLSNEKNIIKYQLPFNFV